MAHEEEDLPGAVPFYARNGRWIGERNKRMQRAIDPDSDMLLDPISFPRPPRRAAKSTEKTVADHMRPPQGD